MCILTCAHREARHGCVPTYTYPRVHLHSNCTKPQLDIHGVPTLTISSIVGTANMCSGCLPSSLYRFSHLSPPKIIRRPMPFIFSPLSFFFFFLLYARHWKLVYWVIRGIINSVEKYEIFFLLSSFSFFFFCFFFENLKS